MEENISVVAIIIILYHLDFLLMCNPAVWLSEGGRSVRLAAGRSAEQAAAVRTAAKEDSQEGLRRTEEDTQEGTEEDATSLSGSATHRRTEEDTQEETE